MNQCADKIYKKTRKIVPLFQVFINLLNPKTWGVLIETFQVTNFDAPFTVSYGQAAEDICLDIVVKNLTINRFGNRRNGFYLDIGAHDPNRFSVTRKLYDFGWNGINVDANPRVCAKFQKYRPRDLFLNYAVGNQKFYDFIQFDEGAISTVNEAWASRYTQEGNSIKQISQISGKSLRSILDLKGVPRSVDLLNIDIEGADEDALKSINFKTLPQERFPKWLLLETTPPIEKALHFGAVKYAVKFGYVPWLVLPMTTLLRAPRH